MSKTQLFSLFGILLIGLSGAFLVGIYGWSPEIGNKIGIGWMNTLMVLGYLFLAFWVYSLNQHRKEYSVNEKTSMDKSQEKPTIKKKRK